MPGRIGCLRICFVDSHRNKRDSGDEGGRCGIKFSTYIEVINLSSPKNINRTIDKKIMMGIITFFRFFVITPSVTKLIIIINNTKINKSKIPVNDIITPFSNHLTIQNVNYVSAVIQ